MNPPPYILERYADAESAYLDGASIAPLHAGCAEGLHDVRRAMGEDDGGGGAAPGVEAGDGGAAGKRRLVGDNSGAVDDLFECTVCMKLFLDPVTVACGRAASQPRALIGRHCVHITECCI